MKKVLIFNYFKGIQSRGIPIYVDNLCVALEKSGVSSSQFVCPFYLRFLPKLLLNYFSVLCEQIFMPICGLAFDRVIYPANSGAIIGALSKKSAIIVHDFIPNSFHDKRISARYIRVTQKLFSVLGRDVIYVSKSTDRIATILHIFPKSSKYCFPNAYYQLMELCSNQPLTRSNDILLCSGWAVTKDLYGALNLYLHSGLYKKRKLRIFGMAGHTEIVTLFCHKNPELLSRIIVLPKIDNASVVKEYETAAWVWVHSKKEGYGRSIAEAKLCRARVVASNIPPFREQQSSTTYFYTNLSEFLHAVHLCEAASASIKNSEPLEHKILLAEIGRFINQ